MRWACGHRFDGPIPPHGMITFVDPQKVRKKRDPGRCYLRAGFKVVARTKKRGLLVLQLLPEEMPDPAQPLLELEAFA